MVHEYDVSCPYCGESFTALVDHSAGNQEYVEDCQICCRPVLFSIEVDKMSESARIDLKTENE